MEPTQGPIGQLLKPEIPTPTPAPRQKKEINKPKPKPRTRLQKRKQESHEVDRDSDTESEPDMIVHTESKQAEPTPMIAEQDDDEHDGHDDDHDSTMSSQPIEHGEDASPLDSSQDTSDSIAAKEPEQQEVLDIQPQDMTDSSQNKQEKRTSNRLKCKPKWMEKGEFVLSQTSTTPDWMCRANYLTSLAHTNLFSGQTNKITSTLLDIVKGKTT